LAAAAGGAVAKHESCAAPSWPAGPADELFSIRLLDVMKAFNALILMIKTAWPGCRIGV
jgi:hypothetical protein